MCLHQLEARLASSCTSISELTLLRLCLPKYSSGPPLSQSGEEETVIFTHFPPIYYYI